MTDDTSPGGFVLLANARAGTAERERVREARGAIASHGPVQVVLSERAGDLGEVLDRLDGRRLVVAGGDGSIHHVVQQLYDRDELGADLAVVPLGTGNDLARGVGIPLDPGEAGRVAATGASRELDLLVDDRGGVVVNAVHAGLGAEAAERSAGMKDGLGPVAYPLGALIAAVQEDGWRLRVAVDGERLGDPDEPVLMVGIANHRTIGGGAPLCPVAEPDDGELDVIVVGAVGATARAAFGAALRDGRHLEREDVWHRPGEEVRINGDAVRYNADGEVSEPIDERTFRVAHRAWRLRVPLLAERTRTP